MQILQSGWDPKAKDWAFSVNLPKPDNYLLKSSVGLDGFAKRIDTSAAMPFEAKVTNKDSTYWSIFFIKDPDASGLTSMGNSETLLPGTRFRLMSSRLLSPSRWKMLEERLEVRIDTIPVNPLLKKIGPLEFSLTLQAFVKPGARLTFRLRPILPDTVFTHFGTGKMLDSTSMGGIQFKAPTDKQDWTFLLQPLPVTGEGLPGKRVSDSLVFNPVIIGKYRLVAYKDQNRDGFWSPGRLRPWTEQEPFSLVLDSLEIPGGGVVDITDRVKLVE